LFTFAVTSFKRSTFDVQLIKQKDEPSLSLILFSNSRINNQSCYSKKLEEIMLLSAITIVKKIKKTIKQITLEVACIYISMF